MSRVDAPELALLRSYPHSSKVYLGIERGITLLSAQIDGLHAEGDTTLQLKNVILPTGDVDDILFGMTVAIHGVEANNRRVDAYFVSYNAGTQVLTIGANAVQADDDQYVTVFSSMKLWKIPHPTFDGEQHIEPFAIIGPPRAGFVDEAIRFVGEFSYSPIGRTLNTPRWHVYQDGVVVGGDTAEFGTEDDPFTVVYPTPGEKLIRFRCDDSAGERSRTFRPVLVKERSGPNAPYSEVVISGCKFNGSGWSANIVCYGVADSTEFVPQALCVLWAEDWYGGTKQNIGGAYLGAGEVVFAGWIRDGSVTVSSDEKSVSFTLDSVESLMQRVTMDDFTFRDGLDTTGWHSFADLNLTKAAAHIIQQHTTLARMADVFLGLFPYELDILDVPQAFLFDQLSQSIGQTAFAYVAGSRFASVTIARNRNMLSAEQRAFLSLASIQFSPQDWLRVTVNEEKFQSTSQVVLEGQDGTGFPLRAVYPVSGPSGAGAIVTQSGMLFLDQAQGDTLAELMHRRDNRGVKGVTIELPNYRILEPSFQEYFYLYLPLAYNNRGYNYIQELNGLQGREFYCVGMDISFRDGAFLVTVTGERSNYGPTGVDWEILDPAPTLEFVYGYGQSATGEVVGVDLLTDDIDELLLDDADISLEEDTP